MAEANLERIEKLIIDGNQGVIDRLEKKIDETKRELRQEIEGSKQELRQEFRQELAKVHSSLKKEIVVTAYALEDKLTDKIEDAKLELKEGIKQISNKLDAHMRQPAHA